MPFGGRYVIHMYTYNITRTLAVCKSGSERSSDDDAVDFYTDNKLVVMVRHHDDVSESAGVGPVLVGC